MCCSTIGCVFCVGQKVSRPILCVGKLTVTEPALFWVTADGHRHTLTKLTILNSYFRFCRPVQTITLIVVNLIKLLLYCVVNLVLLSYSYFLLEPWDLRLFDECSSCKLLAASNKLRNNQFQDGSKESDNDSTSLLLKPQSRERQASPPAVEVSQRLREETTEQPGSNCFCWQKVGRVGWGFTAEEKARIFAIWKRDSILNTFSFNPVSD